MDRWMTSNNEIRPDLALFRRAYVQHAMDMWATYANSHLWLKVPQTIEVPRLFALVERNVIYVNHMARFVKLAACSDVHL